MGEFSGWIGNVREIPGLGREVIGLICIGAAAVCGAAIGLEREHRDKPAGLRTVILICIGSTIYTLISLLLAELKPMADPARLAAQILPGIGFLGAGAIIQSRGNVIGLTTGATIWTTAAIGVTIGAGYVAAGLVFTTVVLGVLTLAQHVGLLVTGRCRKQAVVVTFRPDRGKTWPRIQSILDRHLVHDRYVARHTGSAGPEVVTMTVCTSHRDHRLVLQELAEVSEVEELRVV